MKQIFDMLIQCGNCNETIHHYLDYEGLEAAEETEWFCPRCAPEDTERAKVTVVEVNEAITDPEELSQWLDDVQHTVDDQLVDLYDFFDEEEDGYVPNQPLEVTSITVWTMPPSLIPKREWFTIKEVAERIKNKEESVRTDWKRGRFFRQQTKRYVQMSGSTVLIHEQAIQEVYRVELKLLDFFRKHHDGVFTLQELAKHLKEAEPDVLRAVNRASRDYVDMTVREGQPVYEAGYKLLMEEDAWTDWTSSLTS